MEAPHFFSRKNLYDNFHRHKSIDMQTSCKHYSCRNNQQQNKAGQVALINLSCTKYHLNFLMFSKEQVYFFCYKENWSLEIWSNQIFMKFYLFSLKKMGFWILNLLNF
jgi:hypothetical protein